MRRSQNISFHNSNVSNRTNNSIKKNTIIKVNNQIHENEIKNNKDNKNHQYYQQTCDLYNKQNIINNGDKNMNSTNIHSNLNNNSNNKQSLSRSIIQSTSSFSYQQHHSYSHKLPPLSLPLMSLYRSTKPIISTNTSLLSLNPSNFFIQLFCGSIKQQSVSLCEKCIRTQCSLKLCKFIVEIIQQYYDWQNDYKFQSTYENYNKKKIQIFITDEDILYRLESKFFILGVRIPQNHKLLLVRILKNYIKHTIIYKKYKQLTYQNDIYFWFIIGIYYHVGVPVYFNQFQSLPLNKNIGIHQPLIFWLLDLIMNKIKIITKQKISQLSLNIYDYSNQVFRYEIKSLVEDYHIDLKNIFYQWMNQFMMGYIGIQFIGFYIKSILINGMDYVIKTIMSYFQKRVQKLEKDQIIIVERNNQKLNLTQQIINKKKQQILKILLDSNQEWPAIFYNTSTYQM